MPTYGAFAEAREAVGLDNAGVEKATPWLKAYANAMTALYGSLFKISQQMADWNMEL